MNLVLIDGPDPRKNFPPFWMNEHPLFVENIAEIDKEKFPLIDDFEIVLDGGDRDMWGYHLYFFSKEKGFIAEFPWWDYVEKDLCKENFIVPFEYNDFEQGWRLIISSDEKWVYVCESDFDEPQKGIHRWFKVSKEKYRTEWHLAIDACRNLS